MTKIAGNIRAQRKKHNLSQEELAEKLYVTRQTISNYENGKTNPDVETLQQLATIFETDVDHLIYGDQNPIDKKSVRKAAIILTASLLLAILATILDTLFAAPARNVFKETVLVVTMRMMYIIGYPILLFIIGASLTRIVMLTTQAKFLRMKHRKAAHRVVLFFVILYAVIMLPGIVILIVSSFDKYLWQAANPYGGSYSFGFNFDFGILNTIMLHVLIAFIRFKALYAIFAVLGGLFTLTSPGYSDKKQT